MANEEVKRADEQVVVFLLDKESYGIDIFRVSEIIRLREITPIPKSEEHIRGLVNLRGKTIPVVDLRVRFRLKAQDETDLSRIIVVEAAESQVGIVVDAVTEVVNLEGENIEAAPGLVTELDADFVRGVAKTETGIITLLDLDQALVA